jgi:hypothetical protein
LQHGFRRAFGCDPAFAQKYKPVAEFGRKIQVVKGCQYAYVIIVDHTANSGQYFQLMCQVQMGSRFVKQKGRPSLFASGNYCDRAVRDLENIGGGHGADGDIVVLSGFSLIAAHMWVTSHEDNVANSEIEHRRFGLWNKRESSGDFEGR